MNIAVLGTGSVGTALATALVRNGHNVVMGSRSADNPSAKEWSRANGGSSATFADAAADAEVIINATSGMASIAALTSVGQPALAGKVLIDVANPLDFSNGFPPTLSICNDNSLGEEIQRNFPAARVVKALNTLTCDVMVNPDRVPGSHVLFIAGNDEDAKSDVTQILGEFGWPASRVIDLGDISAARATEMYLPLWLRMMQHIGHANFNVNLAIGEAP